MGLRRARRAGVQSLRGRNIHLLRRADLPLPSPHHLNARDHDRDNRDRTNVGDHYVHVDDNDDDSHHPGAGAAEHHPPQPEDHPGCPESAGASVHDQDDDLQERLDEDNTTAGQLHERTQDPADDSLRGNGLTVRVRGGSLHPARAWRRSEESEEPLARTTLAVEAVRGILVKDDLTPGRLIEGDAVREAFLRDGRLVSVELLTTPEAAAIVATRRTW